MRRGAYDVVLDGARAGSVEMNDTFEISLEVGRHTLQLYSVRKASRTESFTVVEGHTIA